MPYELNMYFNNGSKSTIKQLMVIQKETFISVLETDSYTSETNTYDILLLSFIFDK